MASERRRDAPRISVNKLGEYLTATPARRRQIIQDQKYPPTFKCVRYRDAEKALVDCLVAGLNPNVLHTHRARLAGTQPATEFEQDTLSLCIQAIDCFEDMLDSLDIDGLKLEAGSNDAAPLDVAGVSISVRPELIVTGQDKARPRAGCFKLYFAKNGPLDITTGPIVATVMSQFAEEYLASLGRVDNRLVRVIDVFAGQVFEAPKARTRRLENVAAACEEIAARWPSV